MSLSPRWNLLFVCLLVGWAVVAVVVWRHPLSPSAAVTEKEGAKEEELPTANRRRLLSTTTSNTRQHPFLSNQCYDVVQYLQTEGSKVTYRHNQAYVILPVHNPDIKLLLESVSTTKSPSVLFYKSTLILFRGEMVVYDVGKIDLEKLGFDRSDGAIEANSDFRRLFRQSCEVSWS